jgi:cytochrome c oxidase subunit 4
VFKRVTKPGMAGHDSATDDGAPHVTPLPVYYAVFGALLVLTVITVGVSLLGLPPVESFVVAMLVASVKAAVVALWFMHLISEKRFYSFILLSTVFFMGLFFVLTLVDLSSRDETAIEESHEYWMRYSHERPADQPLLTKPTPVPEATKQGDGDSTPPVEAAP